MRTNIVIDDQLMRETLRTTGLKTKREAVEETTNTAAPHAPVENSMRSWEAALERRLGRDED
jgi:Arc/MetJ family transcription regulator